MILHCLLRNSQPIPKLSIGQSPCDQTSNFAFTASKSLHIGKLPDFHKSIATRDQNLRKPNKEGLAAVDLIDFEDLNLRSSTIVPSVVHHLSRTILMNKTMVLAFLDAEIERLKQARELLSTSGGHNGFRTFHGAGASLRRRHMSAAARRKISLAQKKRWAERKRAARA